MAEVRVQTEGTLWWVAPSGSGNAWATGTLPASGLYGYVRSFTYTSARTLSTISDRGVPVHHKEQSRQPINLTVQFAWTGSQPSGVSGSGASMPMQHLEFRAAQPEVLGTTGRYVQFYGAALQQQQFTENATEDTIQNQFMCLGMSGPSGSGYLS